MNMKSKIWPFGVIVPVILAGCYDTNAEMEVKDDGSVKFRSEAIMRKSIYNLYVNAAGSDIIQARCTELGGQFDVDLAHVNCKIEADTNIQEIIAGDVQNKRNAAPLDLSQLKLVDNGDGTYAVNYVFDWALFGAAVAAEDVNQTASDASQAVEQAAKDAQPATDQTKAVAKDAKETAKSTGSTADEIRRYLDGYHVTMKLKAPKIIQGSGQINGSSDEMTVDVDLGKVDQGTEVLPLNIVATFSTTK